MDDDDPYNFEISFSEATAKVAKSGSTKSKKSSSKSLTSKSTSGSGLDRANSFLSKYSKKTSKSSGSTKAQTTMNKSDNSLEASAFALDSNEFEMSSDYSEDFSSRKSTQLTRKSNTKSALDDSEMSFNAFMEQRSSDEDFSLSEQSPVITKQKASRNNKDYSIDMLSPRDTSGTSTQEILTSNRNMMEYAEGDASQKDLSTEIDTKTTKSVRLPESFGNVRSIADLMAESNISEGPRNSEARKQTDPKASTMEKNASEAEYSMEFSGNEISEEEIVEEEESYYSDFSNNEESSSLPKDITTGTDTHPESLGKVRSIADLMTESVNIPSVQVPESRGKVMSLQELMAVSEGPREPNSEALGKVQNFEELMPKNKDDAKHQPLQSASESLGKVKAFADVMEDSDDEQKRINPQSLGQVKSINEIRMGPAESLLAEKHLQSDDEVPFKIVEEASLASGDDQQSEYESDYPSDNGSSTHASPSKPEMQGDTVMDYPVGHKKNPGRLLSSSHETIKMPFRNSTPEQNDTSNSTKGIPGVVQDESGEVEKDSTLRETSKRHVKIIWDMATEVPSKCDVGTQFTGNNASIQVDLLPPQMQGTSDAAGYVCRQCSCAILNSVSPKDEQKNVERMLSPFPPAPVFLPATKIPAEDTSVDPGEAKSQRNVCWSPGVNQLSSYRQQLLQIQRNIENQRHQMLQFRQQNPVHPLSTLSQTRQYIQKNAPTVRELWQALQEVDSSLTEDQARRLAAAVRPH